MINNDAQQPVKLAVRHWRPTRERGTALLIHGMAGNSLHWEQTALQLQALGYHVIAPDLSGHGDSPRKSTYTLPAWVDEVLAAIEDTHVDVIMGHSLGGVVAAGVSTKLPYEPRQIIMVDPAWYFPAAPIGWIAQRGLVHMRTFNARTLHRQKPHWSGREINIELRSIAAWDTASVRGLRRRECREILKTYLATHTTLTTIVKPPNSMLVRRSHSMQLRKLGVRIVNLPDLSHNLHRDDSPLFVRSIAKLVALPEQHPIFDLLETEAAVERP